MSPFASKKKAGPCCSSGCCEPQEMVTSAVKVLGGGCKNCHKLMENVRHALQALDMDPRVELVADPAAIAAAGVLSTPALMVDGKVVSAGRVLSADQAAEAIRKARGTKE